MSLFLNIIKILFYLINHPTDEINNIRKLIGSDIIIIISFILLCLFCILQ
jgi:hypothetical protein